MSAEVVQGKYDELTEIASRFNEQAENTTQMQQRLRSAFDALRDGGWIGRGAEAFFSEMDSEMFPAVERMYTAMTAGSDVTRQLSEMLRAAEEEAAAIYQNAGDAVQGGMGSGAGGGAAGAGGGGAAGGGTSGGSTSALPPAVPASQVFSEQNMNSLIGAKVRGAGSPALNSAMETLQNLNANPAQVSAALDTIARERGISREAATANYERYKELRANAEARGEAYEPINEGRHGNFLGSEGNLRYGSVAGQALGLDPAFAALLNPSGGLVGPGNNALDRGNSALGYHGAVHDAAGYLYNAQGIGPGYDYLGREGFNDTGFPLTGQSSGIRYWNDRIPTSRTEEFLSELGGDTLGEISTIYTAGSKAVDFVQDAGSWVNDRMPWNW